MKKGEAISTMATTESSKTTNIPTAELAAQIKALKDLCTPDLMASFACALTHDLHVCNECRKCGPSAAEIRIDLVRKLDELIILIDSLDSIE